MSLAFKELYQIVQLNFNVIAKNLYKGEKNVC